MFSEVFVDEAAAKLSYVVLLAWARSRWCGSWLASAGVAGDNFCPL